MLVAWLPKAQQKAHKHCLGNNYWQLNLFEELFLIKKFTCWGPEITCLTVEQTDDTAFHTAITI